MRNQMLFLNNLKRAKMYIAAIIKIKLLLTLILMLLIFNSPIYSQPKSIVSPNGMYKAMLIGTPKDLHYQIKEVKTDIILFTTYAQYPTPNDVKFGIFSVDSKKFAAVYHYGHEGAYTWIGVWEVKTGKSIYSEKKSGWIKEISNVPSPSYMSPDYRYKAEKVGSVENVHYQIIETETNKVLCKTHAKYSTPNNVKAMKFSIDSKKFAAAYHYSHEGDYTWIGVWEIETGEFLFSVEKQGFLTIIPDDVFKK